MGSAKVTYDPEMRKTDHGRRLYGYWKKVHRYTEAPEFKKFSDFFGWAMSNGYIVGAKLLRYDETQPFSPENCFWARRDECVGIGYGKGDTLYRNLTWEQKWDEAVNRIRVHFGMEPIHSSEV